jgi:hypothetical protein
MSTPPTKSSPNPTLSKRNARVIGKQGSERVLPTEPPRRDDKKSDNKR